MPSGRSRRRSPERRPRQGTGRRSVAVPPGTGIGLTVRAVCAGSAHLLLGAIYGQLLDALRQPHRPQSTSNRRPSTPRTAVAYRSVPAWTTCTTPQIRTVLRRPTELAIGLRRSHDLSLIHISEPTRRTPI